MFYTVYKITNLINGKIYIGVHKTKDVDDNYMGSGKYLKRAQEKYGIENFEKEILEVFDNSEEMFEMESKLVNEGFVKRQDTYNLKEGGYGGFDHLNRDMDVMRARNIEAGKKARESFRKWREKNPEKFKENMDKMREKALWYNKNIRTVFNHFEGRTHTEETKKKMRKSHKGKHEGEKNSQYGTMWIHSLKEKRSKKIKKNDLSKWESKGWIKGRKMKFF